MLKQSVRDTLEAIVKNTLFQYSQDETLAYDVSKQCVTDEDVEKCLEVMLEHVSEQELALFIQLFDSELYQRYTQAMTETMRVVDGRIKETLYLLSGRAGEA